MGHPEKIFLKMSDQDSGQSSQNSGLTSEIDASESEANGESVSGQGDQDAGLVDQEGDQNSAVAMVDVLTTPEAIQEKYGVGKSAYYDDLKFLKAQGHTIKSHRDAEKRTILEPETVELIVALREHVAATGNREGFAYSGALAVAEDLSSQGMTTTPPEFESANGAQLDAMVRQAQQLAVRNLVMGDLVVAEMARQIGYEDLPTEMKQQVDQARAATLPKVSPAEIASTLLNRWRAEQQGHQSGAPQSQAAL
jgi:hypothetical protein